MVIGGPGAGKSTFARALGSRLGVPVVHMDTLFWEPGWVMAGETDLRTRVAAAVAGDAWVMDGNYSRTWPIRLARADTVIFLDIATPRRLWRVLGRIAAGYGRDRPDVGPGCPEKLDLDFIVNWVGRYRWRARPKALELIAEAGPAGHLVRHHLTSPRAVAQFLKGQGRKAA